MSKYAADAALLGRPGLGTALADGPVSLRALLCAVADAKTPCTPALLRLYSVSALTAHLLSHKGADGVRSTAWSTKTRPTFADAIAWVRRQL